MLTALQHMLNNWLNFNMFFSKTTEFTPLENL